MQSARPRLNVEYITGVTVISFADESLLAEEVILEVSTELFRMVEEQAVTRLVLDFRDVRYLSSSMIAQLVLLLRKMNKTQGRLKLCGLIPALREVFQTSHLDRLFELYPDVHTALDSF